jgi:hypothetical protein
VLWSNNSSNLVLYSLASIWLWQALLHCLPFAFWVAVAAGAKSRAE